MPRNQMNNLKYSKYSKHSKHSNIYANPFVITIIAIIALLLVLAIFRSSNQYFGTGISGSGHIGDLRGSFQIEAFNNQDLVDSSPHFIMYYVNWCGYCKKAKPEFEKLIQNYNGMIQVKMMDAESDENKQLVHSQNIRTFPTIRYYPSGLQSDYKDYNGNREYNDFLDYLSSIKNLENYEDPNHSPPLENHRFNSVHDMMLSNNI